MRRWLLALAGLTFAAGVGLAAACTVHDRGYFAPRFTPDGSAVLVVMRETRAVVLGFGYETFTPPARVRVARDRFSLLRIRLDDRHVETVQSWPPSPIEGTWIQTYRPSIAGSASAHLRWATPDVVEYELAVSRPSQPSSETFVLRRRWDPAARQLGGADQWQPGHASMGGTETSQLSGSREVVAVRAGGAAACAVLVVTDGQAVAEPLVEEGPCRDRYPDGYPVSALGDVLRRADIERVEQLKSTHERLVAEARARGLGEGDAALEAIRGMQRLGLYPKPSTLVASHAAEAEAGLPIFDITDTEFLVGLFPDIRAAIDRPGEEVEKSGQYVTHRDYDTSRGINEWLDDRRHAVFYVRADAALWRIDVRWR